MEQGQGFIAPMAPLYSNMGQVSPTPRQTVYEKRLFSVNYDFLHPSTTDGLVHAARHVLGIVSRDLFLEGPEKFSHPKSRSKMSLLQSCFIHIFLLGREVLFIQNVSAVYTSPFLDTG